ncbi:MAG: TM0106 family RecB-like putative nuclease [Gaiellaceae bacterium]
MHYLTDKFVFSPSDVTSFLACEHLITLELEVARGLREKPATTNDQAALIRRKGDEHEAAYLRALRAQGKAIAEIAFDYDWDAAQERTLNAMREGVDVVYQAVFTGGGWRGLADFLIRVETPSDLGDWSYEALDTKLARSSKPAYILQLLYYNEQLAALQGREPDRIHVLLGNGTQESFNPKEFAAYYRRVRTRLEEFVADPPPTEPVPVAHCGVCDFKPFCDAHWDAVDHLSRVANISSKQIARLAEDGITTLAGLGRATAEPAPKGISDDTWARIHQQAALQLEARETGRDRVVILPPHPAAGLALLPEPSRGDLFFDFEGNPFWDADGSLEYLWGILDVDRSFTPLHAHDHETERHAFETFVDLVHERLHEYPDMHVYHYAQYEITALKRLMGRYGTREAELDDLLRREVFVDLYKVVRNGVRTSRPGYGLKELETFLDFTRRAEVKDGGTSIIVFEEWMQTRDSALLEQIDSYNEEDCVATLLLRDWLLARRAEAIAESGALPLPPAPEAPKPTPPEKVVRAALRQRLLDHRHELAAQLLDYHARERKPVWWKFFDRIESTPTELVDDAESIGLLQLVGDPDQVTKQSKAYTFTFPAQEHKIGAGQDTFDPATGQSPGEIVAVDRDARRLVLKRGPKVAQRPLPEAIIPGAPYRTDDQEDALERLGRSLLAGDHRYRALETILDRTPFERDVQTTDIEEMKRLVVSLDRRHLVIQGPPGTGKTWTAGRLIAHLMSLGKTVAVASTSHKAIHNLCDAVEEAADEIGLDYHGLKKASSGNRESFYAPTGRIENVTDGDECIDCELAAGTAWLFSDPSHDARFDYLFIDEAGQVSLADALAMGTCARNVVLVGDPQQLDQVVQGTHPSGSGASVLKHLIGDDETIAPNRGLFLERTYRLHPDVCDYISDEFYEGRLVADPCTSERSTPLGTGLRFLPVQHEDRRQDSPEEAAAVVAQVRALRAAGVAAAEIVVVAPYNAHVNLLRESLPEDVRVGTVDKFQGQEADVVIYSMASSSGEDVPRGLQFLLSRNRLNVAVSRARCLAYLVASPKLLEVNTNTIAEMRLANALCRFVELGH